MCSTGVLLHRGEGDTVILTELICSCQENGEGQTVLSLIIKTFPASEVTLRRHVSNFPPSQAGVNNLNCHCSARGGVISRGSQEGPGVWSPQANERRHQLPEGT